MHKIQQTIILIGLGIILLMGLFPPWTFIEEGKPARYMGYAPLWKPPVMQSYDSVQLLGLTLHMDRQSQTANSIDFAKLLMPIAVVAIVTAGAVLLLKPASS